ncbi:hypothetical protein MSG28_002635, partial [Choristoneura fumiferana]
MDPHMTALNSLKKKPSRKILSIMDFSYANATMEESAMVTHLKGVGRLFYIMSPQENMFKKKEDVPNFFIQ